MNSRRPGTGFSFCNYNAHEMLNTIRYAERIYYDRKRDWNKIVERAMSQDFSWKNSAAQYEKSLQRADRRVKSEDSRKTGVYESDEDY